MASTAPWLGEAVRLREQCLTKRAIAARLSVPYNAVVGQLWRAQHTGPQRAPVPYDRAARGNYKKRNIRIQRMAGSEKFKMDAEFSGASARRIASAARERGVEPCDLVKAIIETVFRDDLVKAVLDD